MISNEALEDVRKHLKDRNLGEALAAMEGYLASHPQQTNADRLYAIRADFQLMADYWKRGFKDPQLPALYLSLLQRMYVLYANISNSYAIGHSSYLSSIFMRVHLTAHDRSPQNIREDMESFVTELALLELEPEHRRQEKTETLYRQHQEAMSVLFDYIWTSDIWTDGMAQVMEDMLLLPTIDTNDQQLLISAVMLSALNHFDMAKFRTMVHVYQKATDEQVRQRALVGWVLAVHDPLGRVLYPEMTQLVEKLVEDEACCRELIELQKQMIFCINAERDNQTIQKEIMPELLKNNNFRVTRNGIEEVEEDPMEDILHPDEQERKLEKMEESFQRMIDMQKQGSDIYFGGFSQMKRFPFFQDISNWFVPFYTDHPSIQAVIGKQTSNRFLRSIMEKGPFCNSDKYSFLLAFNQVMAHIPQNLRDMMDRGEASMGEVATEEQQSPAYIRRIYLQDIYRFFRVFPHRSELFNPFDNQDALFFANPVFSRTHLEPYFGEVAAFLIKQRLMAFAGSVLENYGEARRDFQFYMMAGYLLQQHYYVFNDEGADRDLDDLTCYARALEIQPGHERAQLGYARALFHQGRYEEALAAYDQLSDAYPEKRSYLLNRAVCQTNLGRYADALKLLYRLNYETPDDANVNRVLAWALTCDGKYGQAEKIYGQLLTDHSDLEDLLNYGYCLWFSGNVDEAADCFHRYLKESGESPSFILENELSLLREKGVTEPEMQMMLYIL